jgi:hypothetical protein
MLVSKNHLSLSSYKKFDRSRKPMAELRHNYGNAGSAIAVFRICLLAQVFPQAFVNHFQTPKQKCMQQINVGIGFVTGRTHFQNVLRSYVNNWLEHGLVQNENIRLHLYIAYDLKYFGTHISDYKNIPPELAQMVDGIHFLDASKVNKEIQCLANKGILKDKESKLLFGDGYGKKRNVVTYFAIKQKMDRLIFIDDDEYPIATMKNGHNKLVWMGQSVVGTHLQHIEHADITHGHHCGYISPIPYVQFNDTLTENDFGEFIEAISNEIISWDKIRDLTLQHNGVTYANPAIINKQTVTEVEEELGMKFISGANLCFNLHRAENLPPFYNPPGARGEDTFMSTALTNLKVLKVPCYTFHDGFLSYKNLLNGVLPTRLESIVGSSPIILKRFINATIGWVRYKPLMIYITQPKHFDSIMKLMKEKLLVTIPKLCAYFGTNDFEKILPELAYYQKNVVRHFKDFEATKKAWHKLLQAIIQKEKVVKMKLMQTVS